MIYEKVKLYEDHEDVTLATYILDDSVEMLNGGKRGAVLVCPGGAYLYCSDREGEPIALTFANMGYHAFVLRYSVYNENKGQNTMDNIMPDMEKAWEEKKQLQYPAPMRDIGKALLYIREHVEEWHLDVEKIAICGFSAGAHNCAMYSVYYNQPVITEYLGIEKEGIRPAAVILGYTLSNYHTLIKSELGKSPLFIASMKALLGTEDADTETMTEVSPAMLVNETTPPMFLWTTHDDQLVESKQTLNMAYALAEKKIPYEVHVFEQGEHGMALATQATAGDGTQVREDIAVWVPMAATWLRKHIPIKLPEVKSGF